MLFKIGIRNTMGHVSPHIHPKNWFFRTYFREECGGTVRRLHVPPRWKSQSWPASWASVKPLQEMLTLTSDQITLSVNHQLHSPPKTVSVSGTTMRESKLLASAARLKDCIFDFIMDITCCRAFLMCFKTSSWFGGSWKLISLNVFFFFLTVNLSSRCLNKSWRVLPGDK